MTQPARQWTAEDQAKADGILDRLEARKEGALSGPDGVASWRKLLREQAKYYVGKFEQNDPDMLAELDDVLEEEWDQIEDMVRLFAVLEGTGFGHVYEAVRDGKLKLFEMAPGDSEGQEGA